MWGFLTTILRAIRKKKNVNLWTCRQSIHWYYQWTSPASTSKVSRGKCTMTIIVFLSFLFLKVNQENTFSHLYLCFFVALTNLMLFSRGGRCGVKCFAMRMPLFVDWCKLIYNKVKWNKVNVLICVVHVDTLFLLQLNLFLMYYDTFNLCPLENQANDVTGKLNCQVSLIRKHVF